MIKLSYNQAILIQSAQLAYYRQAIGRQGIKKIRKATKPCPGNPETPMCIFDINEMVPRGGNIEAIIKRFGSDPLLLDVHNAIRRGNPY